MSFPPRTGSGLGAVKWDVLLIWALAFMASAALWYCAAKGCVAAWRAVGG